MMNIKYPEISKKSKLNVPLPKNLIWSSILIMSWNFCTVSLTIIHAMIWNTTTKSYSVIKVLCYTFAERKKNF